MNFQEQQLREDVRLESASFGEEHELLLILDKVKNKIKFEPLL